MSEMLLPPSLSPAEVWQIEQICDRFEAAWRAGQRPCLEEYLGPTAEPLRTTLLRQLLPLEWEYRLRAGEQPQTADYEARFPAALALIEAVGREVAAAADGTPPGPGSSATATIADVPLPSRLGEYRILRRLGRGGMGVVYEAVQESLGRQVALKLLPGASLGDPTVRERFRREAQLTAQLQHPNIVQIFEVGEHDGQPFLALEFIAGPSLADLLREAPQPPREAAALVETLARAVHHAHTHGIIHRDLKPANILLRSKSEARNPKSEIRNPKSEPGIGSVRDLLASDFGFRISDFEPKVTDFGLAVPVDGADLTATGEIVGTPGYMAPEQASGKRKQRSVGPATDVYALGAILYHCLTGQPPFQAPTPLDTVLLVVSEELVAPARLQPGVPHDLQTICLKCLEKEPPKRYASAADLAEDLRRFQTGAPIAARPAGRLERALRWARRRPTVAALLAVSVLAAASLLGGGVFFTANLAEQVERAETAEKQARDRAEEAVSEKTRAQTERDRAIFQALRAESARHAIQISVALHAWERHDVAEAEEILSQIDLPFQQTWETRHLRSLCRRKALPVVILRHTDLIRSVAISGDGRYIASGGADGTVKVWDAATGQELLSLWGHTEIVTDVAISAGGKHLVSVGRGQTVKVWDATTGQELRTLQGHTGTITNVAFSPDGQHLATASGGGFDKRRNPLPGEVKVWDTATGQEKLTLKGHRGAIHSVAFSTDGQRLVSGGGDLVSSAGRPVREHDELRVWDVATGQELRVLKGHTQGVSSVAFSTDGRHIVSGSADRTVKVWDAATGQVLRTLWGHMLAVTSVAISTNGKHIVSGSKDQTVKVWDASTGVNKLTLQGHTGPVACVAFSKAHADRVLSVAFPEYRPKAYPGSNIGMVRVWDAVVGQEKLTLKGFYRNPVTSVAIPAGGKHLIAGGGNGTVMVWDAVTGQQLRILQGDKLAVASVALSADGRRIATGSATNPVKVWDAATGQELLTLQGHAAVTYLAFSADGRRIVSGGGAGRVRDHRTGVEEGKAETWGKGEVKVWDAVTGKEQHILQGHTDSVVSVAFRADGARIVSGSMDQTVKVWDTATGKELRTFQGHRGKVTSVAFSPDGKFIISGSEDQTVKVWDAITGKEKFTLLGHTGPVFSVAFSPDGQRLVSGSEDKTLRLWDTATGQEKLTLQGHTSRVTIVAFSADGQHLISGSVDGTVKVWEAPTGIGAGE